MKFPDVDSNKSSSGGIGSGLFLKLKDGEKVQGVFMGDPHIFRQHWIANRSVLCPGKAECENCKGGDKAKFRFRLNFIVKVDGVYQAKVFENGYGMFKDLKEMHEQSYELPKTLVILSRTGEGTDTRYRVLPAKDNGGLKPEQFKKFAVIPLNELSDDGAEETPAAESAEGGEDDSIPF